ncbi:hypothetical protein NP554_02400 [Pseudomonas asiatica]|uniref:Uncharacterized protein n=1 Tax=Pseudomonas asiatica TaxID=2219225 RepID=A0A9X4DAN1_9PSED|nr:hypothetical protein [Pseudomonas asiatica]MDD2110653.1 hypothetical protein [Pseudomonas asiatica]
MQPINLEMETLPPELKARAVCFETNKEVYINLQKQLTAASEEDERINQKASALEGQADRTDDSWRKQARAGVVDQAKINEEIERSANLRKEAAAMRATLESRAGIKNDLVMQVAQARMQLVNEPRALNKAYWQGKINEKLARNGLREELLDIFALSKALCLAGLEEHDGLLRACNGMRQRAEKTQELTWKTFAKEFEKLFAGSEHSTPTSTLVSMPPVVAGEAVVNTPGELLKLQRMHASS